MTRKEKLAARTLRIIDNGGAIYLKNDNGSYLSCWTNVVAGWDKFDWALRHSAMAFFDLETAFAVRGLCQYPERVSVVSYFPRRKCGATQ